MNNDKVSIEDLDNEDIVFVNTEHGYCSIKEINYGFNGGIAITFEHTDLGLPNKSFTKFYNSNKKFKLFA